ncbi:MAG: hypothetical protein ABI791_07875 [Acidobacteriota bacterium]
MKDFLLFLVQIIGTVSFLGGIFALMNRLFGWSIGIKGAALPADFRAAAMLFGIAAVCGAIVYLLGRKK